MNLTRRDFLKTSLGASTVLSFGSTLPAFLSRLAFAGARGSPGEERVLVVVQLTGGNDGLNTVVPFEDDAYARNRPTLRLRSPDLHRIDSSLGFHRELTAFFRLYEKERLCVLQGVGYPGSSRDHEAALRHWQTAMPGEGACQTGWVGRVADHLATAGNITAPATFVGSIPRPLGLNARRAVVPRIESLRQARLRTFPAEKKGQEHRETILRLARLERPTADNAYLELLRTGMEDAHSRSNRIEAVSARQGPGGSYPAFGLARTLQTVARLIKAEVGVRVYFTELGGGGIGGFDTHANQAANHGALLRQLSESVHAFLADLGTDGLLDRVLLLTFSEFGRTVEENGRRGTDHGAAAPLFLAGSRIRAGIIGEHPSLVDVDNGGLKHHTDFRSVYATVLEKWLGVESREVLGGTFETLDVLKV